MLIIRKEVRGAEGSLSLQKSKMKRKGWRVERSKVKMNRGRGREAGIGRKGEEMSEGLE